MQRVYFGTYADAIYTATMDPASGALSAVQKVADTPAPSFLAFHPNGKYLYAVNETRQGSISAFELLPGGRLAALNVVSAEGDAPCHLTVSRSGKHVLAANYSSGNATVHALNGNGSIGALTANVQHKGESVNPQRQKGPHAHSINLDAAGAYAFVADLGLDQVKVYQFDDATGALTGAGDYAMAPGSGPRHLCFHPSGKFVYVVNEMLCTVNVAAYVAKGGKLSSVQTIATMDLALRPEFSTAEVVAHPNGKWLYNSNRGHHSITHYGIDSKTGKLARLSNTPILGKTPRNFVLDPTGNYLLAAGQDSDSVTVFKIDGTTGSLTHTGQPGACPKPVCIRFGGMV